MTIFKRGDCVIKVSNDAHPMRIPAGTLGVVWDFHDGCYNVYFSDYPFPIAESYEDSYWTMQALDIQSAPK